MGWIVAAAFAALAAWLGVRLLIERRRADAAAAAAAQAASTERELAAEQERSRIAREMHDVVAHTLTVVVAQADGGRFASRAEPAAGVHALETIAEVGRAALTEMRALLGVLRGAEGGGELGPQPSIGDLPALVDTNRSGGLAVSFVTTGTARPLPIGAGLALYRVAQEALTNVRRHAGPAASAYLQLAWAHESVTLTVSDDGRGAAAPDSGDGTGIEGMRQRVTVFGGTLSTGPRAGGGFVVRATMPLGSPGVQEHAGDEEAR